jgi:predicted transcriptional regulator of viral defense system
MTPVLDRRETALKLARSLGVLRAREVAAAGVDRSTLARLCESGLLERLERGLYGLPAAAVREHVDLEIVAKRVPQAVFCLLTALRRTTDSAPSNRGGSGSACPGASTPQRCSSPRWR